MCITLWRKWRSVVAIFNIGRWPTFGEMWWYMLWLLEAFFLGKRLFLLISKSLPASFWWISWPNLWFLPVIERQLLSILYSSASLDKTGFSVATSLEITYSIMPLSMLHCMSDTRTVTNIRLKLNKNTNNLFWIFIDNLLISNVINDEALCSLERNNMETVILHDHHIYILLGKDLTIVRLFFVLA